MMMEILSTQMDVMNSVNLKHVEMEILISMSNVMMEI